MALAHLFWRETTSSSVRGVELEEEKRRRGEGVALARGMAREERRQARESILFVCGGRGKVKKKKKKEKRKLFFGSRNKLLYGNYI